MKVLFAASEALPFKSSGGLAEVTGSLPKALRRRFVGARVVMPYYDSIAQELKDNMKFLTHIVVPVAWRRQYCGIFEARANNVIYYLIDNQYYFKRGSQIYGHYDDAERFAFFSRAVLEILPYLGDFKPDVIHCNDWQTALVPVYQTTLYGQNEFYQGIKTVFTIHNIEYQGKYSMDLLQDVFGLSPHHASLVEHDSCINLMKGGIECADAVTTVSPTYAGEILTPYYAHGLDSILSKRRYKLSGILNGIDIDSYNPETDRDIPANFTAGDVSGKRTCKAALQKELGLHEDPSLPLIGIVSRLVTHKGIDLIMAKFDELLANSNAQLALLGSGEYVYETYFRELSARFPGRVGVCINFIPALSRQIYAGSDLFLMPSKSEPCGLSQMIALRYGSIPVVRETGGLKDTVQDSGLGQGNGFSFHDYNAEELLRTLYRALQGFQDHEGWTILVKRAMECDNSWGISANEYMKLYKALTSS